MYKYTAVQLSQYTMGFVVDKAALGQVFSGDFGFPRQSFHRLIYTHHHPQSGAGTIGQIVADIPRGSVVVQALCYEPEDTMR
jgi:hypothetical protein